MAEKDEKEEALLPFDHLLEVYSAFQNFLGFPEFHEPHKRSPTFKRLLSIIFWPCFVNRFISLVQQSAGATTFISEINIYNFYILIEGLSCSLCNQIVTVKHAMMIVKKKQMSEVITQLRNLYDMREYDEKETRIINARVRNARRILSIYCNQTVMTGSIYTLAACLWGFYLYATGQRQGRLLVLPYLFWYPYDPEEANFAVYYASWFTQVWAGLCSGCAMCVFDGILCTVLTHLSIHYELMAHNLELVGAHDAGVAHDERERRDARRIGLVVSLHAQLLEIGDSVNGAFGFALIDTITIMSAMICCLAFGMTVAPLTLAIKYLLLILLASIQLMLLSYYGERLKTSSYNIVDAAYDSNWTSASMKTKKSILQIITQAKKYRSVSAFGFAELSMLTCMSVWKVSMSYFALLQTMYANLLEKYEGVIKN